MKPVLFLRCILLAALLAGLTGHRASAQPPVMATGDDFTVIIDDNNNLYTYGANGTGQLGTGTSGTFSASIQLIEPTGVWEDVAVSKSSGAGAGSASGEGHVLAIQTDGSLWAWGDNSSGQLGLGTFTNAASPQLVDNSETWVEVAAGSDFSMARTDSGQIYVWGSNAEGQLAKTIIIWTDPGDGSISPNLYPSPSLLDGNAYRSIAAGLQVALAVRNDGRLFAWGTDTLMIGQPGPIAGPVTTPLQIGSSTNWMELFTGNTVAFGIQRSGRLYAWGAGINIGLGGSPYERFTPSQVGTSTNWASVSVGWDHTLALNNAGELLGWGDNTQGELGLPHFKPNGDPIVENLAPKLSPTLLQTGRAFQAVGAGQNFSSIYTTGGFLESAGIGDSGQLGNGTVLADGDFQTSFTNTTLGLSDIAALSVTVATASPAAGGPLTATVLLKNLGTGTISNDFQLGAVLSPTPTFDSLGAIPLTFNSGQTVTADFAPGDEVGAGFTVQLPPAIPIDEYHLVVRADIGAVLTETTRANNDVATDSPSVVFAADIQAVSTNITVTPVGGPFPLNPGDQIQVQTILTNEGNGDIPSGTSFDLRHLLATVDNTNASGIVELDLSGGLDPVLTNGIPVGGSTTNVSTFSLPDAIGIGNFFLGVEADPQDTVAETNENNNIAFTQTAVVQIAGIDIPEAVDNFDLDFSLIGDGLWYGSANTNIVGGAVDNDAAVSPPLSVGEFAMLQTFIEDPSAVSFRWRAETSSATNRLTFGLFGGTLAVGDNEISGSTPWINETRIVPGGVNIFWMYSEGLASASDAVFVDDIQVGPVNDPDFVVNGASLTENGEEVDTARIVLGRDRLEMAIQVLNQGLTHPATGTPYDVRAYLSADASFNPTNDILVYSNTNSTGINQSEISLLFPSVQLPTDIPAGFYRVIVVVDETDAVTEISELNNTFISDSAIIEIALLPDLLISGLNPEPGFYIVGESIDFDFTLQNIGLAPAVGSIASRFVLSVDNNIEVDDYLLGQFTYIGALAAGGQPGSSVTFQPDITDIRSDVPIGDFLYFGTVVDSADNFEELNENNNTAFFLNPYFVFAEVEIEEAMEFDVIGSAAQNNETIPFLGDKPFIGQISETFDGIDAVQNVDIENGQTAAFETTIVTDSPSVLTFNWKVSSEQQVLEDGTVKEDTLNVYVNGVLQSSISGEVDWSEVRVSLDEAGTYTVRWTYEKDGTVSDGQDTGWVDNFRYTIPDLEITDISVAPQSITPNSLLNFAFRVTNVGTDPVPATPTYPVDIRLSANSTWGGGDDVKITVTPEVRSTLALAAGESETFTVSAIIPPNFAQQGDFYLGVRADPDPNTDDDAVNGPGLIPEVDEVNNTRFTSTALITITPPITLDEAVDDQDPDDVDPDNLLLVTGGASAWFGLHLTNIVDNIDLFPDNTFQFNPGDTNRDDIAQSGPIDNGETSYFETQIEGPKLVKFRWKVDSRAGVNLLEARVNGIEQETVSGKVDWETGFGPFTLTFEGETTAQIPSDADAPSVENALNALLSISDVGGVTVTRSITNNAAFNYTIAFNNNGNQPLIEFTSLSSVRILTERVSTSLPGGQNGTTGQQEIQIMSIEPNVYFNLTFDTETTDNISYLADAADVETALNALPSITAAGGVSVSNHTSQISSLDFLVAFSNAGERALIEVDPTGLRQPVTIENQLRSDWYRTGGLQGVAGDAGTAQVQPLRIGDEITLFVPASGNTGTSPTNAPQTVRWQYRKTGTPGDALDAGWVDQIQVYDFNQPELVLQSIDYEPGEYVLDVAGIVGAPNQLVGTENLSISVAAANQGTNLSTNMSAFTSADIEVRLSSDNLYGNADDIVLGSFTQVEGSLETGDLLRFIGPLPLGDHIPEGCYYLIAIIDANDRLLDGSGRPREYDTENNVLITANNDVCIDRRPRLFLFDSEAAGLSSTFTAYYTDVLEMEETRLQVPKSPVRLRFQIQNRGLDNLFDENGTVIPWTSDVNLAIMRRDDLQGWILAEQPDAVEFQNRILTTMDLGEFSIAEAMEGRRNGAIDGDILDLDLELYLPTAARILTAIAPDPIGEMAFFIQIVLDSEDDVEESGVINVFNTVNLATATEPPLGSADDNDDGLFSIETTSLQSFGTWTNYYGINPSDTNDFLAYAFGRDPLSIETNEFSYPGSFGFEQQLDGKYFSVVFDFPIYATDLSYVVQAGTNLMSSFTNDLVTITPPYDDPAGPGSLTSDGGLISSNQVSSVVDGGDTARITVFDTDAAELNTMRFIRILVNTNTVPVP